MNKWSFRTWLENDGFDQEQGSHIKINLPSVKQSDDFDCGAAALRSVCEYFKVGPEDESDFIKACKTSKSQGTKPPDLIRAARLFGLNTQPRSGMSIGDLKKSLDLKRPVICCIQAYGDRKQYSDKMSGHYAIAIGHDARHIYFEDPSMTGSRGFLPFKEFIKRWKDKDGDGNVYERFGITMWKPSDEGTDREYVPRAKKIP
jgi:predicted double-glycine peptidase